MADLDAEPRYFVNADEAVVCGLWALSPSGSYAREDCRYWVDREHSGRGVWLIVYHGNVLYGVSGEPKRFTSPITAINHVELLLHTQQLLRTLRAEGGKHG